MANKGEKLKIIQLWIPGMIFRLRELPPREASKTPKLPESHAIFKRAIFSRLHFRAEIC